MNAADHLRAAEQQLQDAKYRSGSWESAEILTTVLTSIGHALIAIAIENGTPHRQAAPEVTSGG